MAKILIVEDERSIRQALRFELEDEGWDVHYASDFSEAISALSAFDYEVIIFDIYLKNGNGLQLMEWVKRNKNEILFIAMTAYPDSEPAQKIKTILGDCFFEKPFFATELKEKVNELLTKRVYKSMEVPREAYCS